MYRRVGGEGVVAAGEGVGGRGLGGGVGRGLTIEVERLVYVLRRRDPAMS